MSFKTVLSENQLGSRGYLLMIQFRFKVYPVFFCLILAGLTVIKNVWQKWYWMCFENRPQRGLKFHPDVLLHSLLGGPCRDPHAVSYQVKSWIRVWSMMSVKSMARSQHQLALLGVIHLGCPAKLGLQRNAASADIWLQVMRVLSF